MAGELQADPLFVGLTRPPMLFGASYGFTVLNGIGSLLAYVATSDFKYLAMMFPIHAVGYYICSKEPLFIELFRVRAEKCSRCRNKLFHGANSYDQY